MNFHGSAPQTIITATRLLWLDVAIGLINYVYEYLQSNHGMILVLSGVLLIGLVGFINHHLLRARNWVRWLMVALTLTSLSGVFLREVQGSSVNLLFAAITTILEVAAIYLVFCSASKAWFNERRAQ